MVENDTEIMTEPEERAENVSNLASIEIHNDGVQKTDFDEIIQLKSTHPKRNIPEGRSRAIALCARCASTRT